MGYEKAEGIRTGSGLSRRIIRGRGSPERTDSESDSDDDTPAIDKDKMLLGNNNKYGINLAKLRKNTLHVFYASSRASIPQLKRESISNDVRDVLTDILSGNYNEKLFNKMASPDDQRLVSTFVRVMKIPGISMTEFDRSYQDHFNILQGEINSGNSNVAIRNEYKQHVLRAMSESIIPRHQGLNMLFKMSL